MRHITAPLRRWKLAGNVLRIYNCFWKTEFFDFMNTNFYHWKFNFNFLLIKFGIEINYQLNSVHNCGVFPWTNTKHTRAAKVFPKHLPTLRRSSTNSCSELSWGLEKCPRNPGLSSGHFAPFPWKLCCGLKERNPSSFSGYYFYRETARKCMQKVQKAGELYRDGKMNFRTFLSLPPGILKARSMLTFPFCGI